MQVEFEAPKRPPRPKDSYLEGPIESVVVALAHLDSSVPVEERRIDDPVRIGEITTLVNALAPNPFESVAVGARDGGLRVHLRFFGHGQSVVASLTEAPSLSTAILSVRRGPFVELDDRFGLIAQLAEELFADR